nr:MAG TPA: hypothetical protein [Caudoviricetes sp.]
MQFSLSRISAISFTIFLVLSFTVIVYTSFLDFSLLFSYS